MEIAERIAILIKEVTEDAVVISPSNLSVPLKEQGVDSVALLRLLVAIEDDIGIEWSEDTPPEVFISVQTIAEYLSRTIA